jgi:hypothetical protein
MLSCVLSRKLIKVLPYGWVGLSEDCGVGAVRCGGEMGGDALDGIRHAGPERVAVVGMVYSQPEAARPRRRMQHLPLLPVQGPVRPHLRRNRRPAPRSVSADSGRSRGGFAPKCMESHSVARHCRVMISPIVGPIVLGVYVGWVTRALSSSSLRRVVFRYLEIPDHARPGPPDQRGRLSTGRARKARRAAASKEGVRRGRGRGR